MIIAEAISFGPEVLLLFAVALLLYAAAVVAYVAGGFIAIRRVAAGSRSPGAVLLAALAALIGAYILGVSLVERDWTGAEVLPAVHALAAWRGRRDADAAPAIGPPPPPPTGPPPPPPA